MATVSPLAACGVRGGLLRAASAETASAARASAMDAYLRVVFAGDAKAKHPPELTGALWPLVRTLTHEEMSEEVIPRATRQPPIAGGDKAPVRRLLETTTLDLSAHAPALVEPILAQVKHADAWRREEAVGCLAAIVDSSAEEEACRSIFDAVRADVDDPKRRPKEWQARAGLYHLLRALTRAKLTEKATAAMAEEACACLAGACGSGGATRREGRRGGGARRMADATLGFASKRRSRTSSPPPRKTPRMGNTSLCFARSRVRSRSTPVWRRARRLSSSLSRPSPRRARRSPVSASRAPWRSTSSRARRRRTRTPREGRRRKGCGKRRSDPTGRTFLPRRRRSSAPRIRRRWRRSRAR